MKFKCDYSLLDHAGNSVDFSGQWLDLDKLDYVMAYMSNLVSYNAGFKSIRFYFSDERSEDCEK